MKAKITLYIGAIVVILNIIQIGVSIEPSRFIGFDVGLFFIFLES